MESTFLTLCMRRYRRLPTTLLDAPKFLAAFFITGTNSGLFFSAVFYNNHCIITIQTRKWCKQNEKFPWCSGVKWCIHSVCTHITWAAKSKICVFGHEHLAKTQITLLFRAIWSASSLWAIWMRVDSKLFHVALSRLIYTFAQFN